MKILVGAAISSPPYAPGKAWHRLHYIRGLQKLGHDVYFIEELDPTSCADAQGRQVNFELSLNQRLFVTAMEAFGLEGNACLIYNHGQATLGLSLESLTALSKNVDVLINWSGHVKTDCILNNVKRRIYLDQDPVYTQLWQEEYGVDLNFDSHDVFFSVGLNIGTPYTPIPDCGVEWHHTLPPVILEDWPFHIETSCRRFTTIASLVAYNDLCYQGEWYMSKHAGLNSLMKLPKMVTQEFEIALKWYNEEKPNLQFLTENGWHLADASKITNLSDYQNYIQASRGEIGIPQNAYVKGLSGWFSDRWSHYLASGKPVLAQSTGFERCVPTGRGLLTFTSVEEAAEGINMINQDYASHCRAARELAEEYLDYRKVLPKMLHVCTSN